ncbi:MAG: FixH family protein, partial [Alphaproteobacteria bacterium]
MPAAMTQKPFTGRKMLMWTVGFFGVIIAVNLVLLVFALRTHTGLVAPNSYVASQNFNRKAAEAHAQAARGWKTGAVYGRGVLELTFAGPDGEPIRDLHVEGGVGRPVSAAEDRRVVFTQAAPGVYHAETKLGPGEWIVEAVATGTGAPYR